MRPSAGTHRLANMQRVRYSQRMSLDRLFRHAIIHQVCIWTILFVWIWLRFADMATGVFFGGLLMLFNLLLMRYTQRTLEKSGGIPHVIVAVLAGKLVVMLLATAAVIWLFDPDLLGFALGLATFFVGMFAAFLWVWRTPRTSPPAFTSRGC